MLWLCGGGEGEDGDENKVLLGSAWKKDAAFDLRTIRGVVLEAEGPSSSLVGDEEETEDWEGTGEGESSPNLVNMTQSTNLPGSLTLRTEGPLVK